LRRARGLAIGLMLLSSLTIIGFAHPRAAQATDGDAELIATLDGKPIPVEDVGRYYCDDFSYPEIRCSRSRLGPDARATLVGLLTAVDYVTIFDATNYGGAFMNVSQNYAALSSIGWNDRISSFKGRNGENGAFYVDWFYSGSFWAFCCNSQYSSLGAYNNTFSSISRS
jgi:hypothetical protein